MGYGKHEKPNEGATNVWLTPPSLIDRLGPFDLDPCAAPEPRPWATAKRHYVAHQDGLTLPWEGNVWVNPPYGPHAEAWLVKLAGHGAGIALVFARTETEWFQKIIRQADWLLLFPKGRLVFCTPDGKPASGNAGAPSVFLAVGEDCKRRLKHSGIDGFFCVPSFSADFLS